MVSRRIRLNPVIRRLLSILAVVYFVSCLVLYVFQRDLLYFPTAEIEHSYPVLSILSGTETLNVIALNKGQSQAMIYFGGNSEQVVLQADEHIQNFPNHTIYLVNYRGYGGSTGSPSEEGLFQDALNIFDALKSRHEQISVMGRSLGTGVAVYLAVNRPVDKLILVTPYDSIEAIAQNQYPVFPVDLLLHDRFDSVNRVAGITSPTLIIVAEQDRIIPRKNTLALIHAFSPPLLTVKAFKNAGHNDVSGLPGYHKALQAFVADAV